MKKRVYIAYTGGTIGMGKTSDGYVPAEGLLQKLMAAIPELKHDTMPEYEVHEYRPLLDSANMVPGDWLNIAEDIKKNDHRFDGFVVLHGTDTMAYTASALPFLLSGLRKPVVLTGAQIPLCEVRNDARENLITAMMIAANFDIPEVCLCFGNKLLRGNRSVKVNADGFDAFASPNFPALGSVGVEIKINRNLVLPPPDRACRLEIESLSKARAAVMRLFPGIPAEIFTGLFKAPIKGIVLETYGIGNGPENDDALITALKKACDNGIIVVNCTQCLKGTVDMEGYVTGSALAAAGVISGFDMTVEAALAKMFYLFSQDLTTDALKKMMQTDLRGELSASNEKRSIDI